MKTISKRITQAFKHLAGDDLEDALIHACIAIDATAKKKYPETRVGARIRAFVQEYEPFIYQFASNGVLLQGGTLSIDGEELPDILYVIRCALHHGDDEIDEMIEFTNESKIGKPNGKQLVNRGHISGLIFSVISDEVNSDEKLDDNYVFENLNDKVQVNELWGGLTRIERFWGYKKDVSHLISED